MRLCRGHLRNVEEQKTSQYSMVHLSVSKKKGSLNISDLLILKML